MMFFLSLLPFSILKIKKRAFSVESPYHKDSNTSRPLNKVKPCSVGLVLGWVTKYKCRINKQRNTSFEFTSILLTVDRLKI